MLNRRGFLARLFAAPIVALALLKAPVCTPHVLGSFGDDPSVLDIEEMRQRYIMPAARAMVNAHDKWLMEMFSK